MKVVVIIPTYNERENIIELLTKLESVRKKVISHEVHFLVVDDSSPDGTQEVVGEYGKSHKHVHILTGKKEGLGKALLRGMEYAANQLGADIIGQIDADLSHDPKKLPEFFRALASGYDFVIGSRYIQGGGIPENWGTHRKIYSVLGNAFVRYGLGYSRVHDWTGGYRVYNKKYYEALAPQLSRYNGYVFQIAFLHKAIQMGARVFEVPFHFTDRRFGHSKIAPSQYIRDVLRYVATHGTFSKFLTVGVLGFIINTFVLELLVWLGFHPAAGSAIGAECAIVSNFIFNNAWTFRHKKIIGDRKVGKFLQFNLTSLAGLVIQSGTVWLGSFLFGVESYRLYYVVGVAAGLTVNYMMYSKVIWK